MSYATNSTGATSSNNKRTVFSGIFENGNRHGTGELRDVPDKYLYTGDFENDLPHGYAHIEWSDDSRFTGRMVLGRLDNGSFTFPSGNHYQGGFDGSNGKFGGQGTFQNQNELMIGEWH